MTMRRREFLTGASGVLAATASLSSKVDAAVDGQRVPDPQTRSASFQEGRAFNGTYQGEYLNQIAFPLGGMGAGMICLEGTGSLAKFSLHHRPDLNSQPIVFAAVSIKRPSPAARVLEGPVPAWKVPYRYLPRGNPPTLVWGLPRFHNAEFTARYPFATVRLRDRHMPIEVAITGWSPFFPGDADNASLPVAGLEYALSNQSDSAIEGVFSFNSENFMARQAVGVDRILPTGRGFMLYGAGAPGRTWESGHCAILVDDPAARVNCAWHSGWGDWYNDSIRRLWNEIESSRMPERDPLLTASAYGASIFVPFTLERAETRTFRVLVCWYVPQSDVGYGFAIQDGKPMLSEHPAETYRPWYSGRFDGIDAVRAYWQNRYFWLREATETFARTFADSTLPPEVMEAVAANLTILKSPTVLRQVDGRLCSFDGVGDSEGLGPPGCGTHVWNYAQALPHLFPNLERGIRETEFGPDLAPDGYQFDRSFVPIRPIGAEMEYTVTAPMVEGQLGGIIKTYRDWRISGDTAWLRSLWAYVRLSLDFCINTWDPKHRGWIEEPHWVTYDQKFWGAESVTTSLYAGALRAASLMGEALGEDVLVYTQLWRECVRRLGTDLFNGEYFFQEVKWRGLKTVMTRDNCYEEGTFVSDELWALAQTEGPAYQYGPGCFSDGVLGAWLCTVSGLDSGVSRTKIASHLAAVHRHNLKTDLLDCARVARKLLAAGSEKGLVLCTWPRGGRPTLPPPYSDESWTGTEYQVASHLMALGMTEQGLEIVRAVRDRYDGRIRNPFAEVEAGVWYGRAMSSYALLQAFSGARFDAVDKVLYLRPAAKGDFRCFLSTATGYGTVGVKDGKPFLDVVDGEIPYRRIDYTPAN